MTKMSGRSWGEPCLLLASMTVRWRWGLAAQIFQLLRIFFCFDLGFLIEISESILSECIPYKNPEKDTKCSPEKRINTKTLLCVHSTILIFACCFHGRICWALWPVSCTWAMSSLLLMSRGMLRSLQRIRSNTWPGWVSPGREVNCRGFLTLSLIPSNNCRQWFRSSHKFHFYLP